MPVQNQDSFLKIAQTAQHAEVRYIFFYTSSPSATLLWQSFAKGPTVEKSPEVQRIVDMISTVLRTKT